ncbi:MAG: thiamine-binding protein [Leptolyngbya sp. PLA3]|nr:MAG: MTH1187 family thiamine-binding protein [Cyanobacteria bacterium CYA]MCE7967836.1 thiamine-binding protein [Leptolyngbya sp. PL-A3]
MQVIVDFTVIPIGVGVSLSAYVAACEQVLADAGLRHTLHANGTGVEGEWDEVFVALRRCHEVVHRMGAPRISTIIKIGTRTDRKQTMADKVQSVHAQRQA